MRISVALELAEQSIHDFEAKLEQLSIAELYELTDNLRFTDNPIVSKTSYIILLDKLASLLEEVQELEETVKGEGFDILSHQIFEETGFHLSSDTLPSVGLREYIDDILKWYSHD